MIKISVASFNNTPSAQALAHTFDELGGTIGRGDTNQLILPDPERSISRVHAQVVYRNGRFALVDKGSNPVLINGRAPGNGVEVPIQAGDQIQIGGYLLLVEAAAPAPGHAPTHRADPFAAPPPTMAAAPAAPSSDPFAGFWSPSPAPAVPVSPAPSAGKAGIPDDWNLLATPAPAPPAAAANPFGAAPPLAGGTNPNDPFGLFGGSTPGGPTSASPAESSIDQLFGLGSNTGSDPFANTPLGAGLGGPNTAADLDPLRALSQEHRPAEAAISDQGSDLNTPFMAPPSRVATGPATPAPAAPPHSSAPAAGGMFLPDDIDFLAPVTPGRPAASVPPAAPATPVAASIPAQASELPASPQGAVLSWGDSAPADGRTVIKPGRIGAPAQPTAPEPAPVMPPPAPAVVEPWPEAAPITALAPQAPPAAPSTPPAVAGTTSTLPQSGDVRALLDAFREGLGTPTVQVDALTPEVMRLLGQLIHASTQGTVDLLVARAAFKREVRAEMTMIVAQKNNPLKFSPTVEVALGHLLHPPQRGFMPAAQAMQDAFDDLRAHQFGMMAGMKAALEGVLKRFDPAQLETKLTQKSVLATLLPSSRKAQMWEVFQELYTHISAEASDDFHELFGKAFVQAYEAQLDELSNERARQR